MSTDYNLLFASLALQLEYITPDQLAEGCTEWLRSGEASAADVFLKRGWITASVRDEIDRYAQRKIQKNNEDVRSALSEATDIPTRMLLRRLDEGSVENTVDCLAPAAGGAETSSEFQLRERTHYSRSEIRGEGGLGRVWLAHDPTLNRTVALKEVKPKLQNEPEHIRRFIHEAQITGQLDHPNIISVFELASDSGDSLPFYTMRFMQGRTFREAISEHHRLRAERRADDAQLKDLLNDFVSICNALDYAHSKGVIHRDLKPANIMTGHFGEVVVLDWGLARLFNATEDATTPLDGIELSDAADREATAEGQARGTPSYMAPEQAAGRLDLDVRTDVYGLGAILFCLLTDRAPHFNKTHSMLLKQIVNGDSPRVRDRSADVPPPLDAICARAMAKEPDDRYRTARELAADVRRWLADLPVSAYDESAIEKTRRWARKHQNWVLAVVTSMFAIILAAGLTIFLVSRAKAEAETARDAERTAKEAETDARRREETAKAKAIERLGETRVAIETWVTGLDEVIKDYPGMQDLRQRALRAAIEDFQRIAQEENDDPDLRAESARSYLHIGHVYSLTAEYQAAIQATASALAIFQQLANNDPGHARWPVELTKAKHQAANLLAQLGRADDAKTSFRDAIASYDELLNADPRPIDVRIARANCLTDFASRCFLADHPESALELLDDAKSAFDSIAADHPDEDYVTGMANSLGLHGNCLRRLGRFDEAIDDTRRAVTVFRDQARRFPDRIELAEGLAKNLMQLANALQLGGRLREANDVHLGAINELEVIVAARHDVLFDRFNLAVARRNYAWFLHENGNNAVAQTIARQAVDGFDTLATTRVCLPKYVEGAGQSRLVLGKILIDMGDPAAEQVLFGAIDLFANELLLEDPRLLPAQFRSTEILAPGALRYLQGLGTAQAFLGRYFHTADRTDDAELAYKMALDEFAKGLDADAAHAGCRNGQAWARRYLAELLADLDPPEWDTSRDEYAQAIALWEGLPDQPVYRLPLANLLANAREEPGKAWRVRKPKRAIELAEGLVRTASDNPNFRHALGVALLRSAESVADPAAAEASLNRAASELGEAQRFRRIRLPGDATAGVNPFDLAFLSIVQRRLGNVSEAAELLLKARARAVTAGHRGDPEFGSVLKEAETPTASADEPSRDP